MLKPFLSLIKGLVFAAKSDRIEIKFDRIDDKLDHLDARIDEIDKSQSNQTSKLTSLHEISQANNGALEQKLNAVKSSTDAGLSIVNSKFSSIHEAFSRLERLVIEVITKKN
jgi:hypothetical protein